jgi:pyridoxine kinase
MAPTLLSIQSHVVYGHVGNSAVAFPLQRLGAEVLPLNTVQFSSHAGYPGWRGRVFDAVAIDECVAGLVNVGALARCDGVLSGYLGKAEVGEAMLRAVAAVRTANPAAAYCCDPVIGDVGRGIYVETGVAEFFAKRALPAATVVTPNAFELSFVTGLAVDDVVGARRAIAALQAIGPRVVMATSLALNDAPADALDMIAAEAGEAWRLRTPRLPIAVNGAGDLIAALFFLHWLKRRAAADALAAAAASVYGVVAATAAAGSRELRLVEAQEELVRPTQRFRPETI